MSELLPLLAQSFAPDHLFVHWSLTDLANLMRTSKDKCLEVQDHLVSHYGRESVYLPHYVLEHGYQEAANSVVHNDNVDALRLLLEHEKDFCANILVSPLDISEENRNLFGCCRRQRWTLFSYLLEIASKQGSYEVARFLIVERSMKPHEMALSYAVINGNLDIVQLFIEQNEKLLPEVAPNSVRLQEQETIIRVAGDAAEKGHVETVQFLLKKGAIPGLLMEHAAWRGQINVIRFLVEEIDSDLAVDGMALNTAARWEQFDVIRFLVNYNEENANHGDVLKIIAEKGVLT